MRYVLYISTKHSVAIIRVSADYKRATTLWGTVASPWQPSHEPLHYRFIQIWGDNESRSMPCCCVAIHTRSPLAPDHPDCTNSTGHAAAACLPACSAHFLPPSESPFASSSYRWSGPQVRRRCCRTGQRTGQGMPSPGPHTGRGNGRSPCSSASSGGGRLSRRWTSSSGPARTYRVDSGRRRLWAARWLGPHPLWTPISSGGTGRATLCALAPLLSTVVP